MKIQHKLLILILFAKSICSYSQNELYTLLTIDDVNVEPSFIADSFIDIDNHRIETKYKVGRFEISSNDYKFLKQMNPDSKVNLSFIFLATCPEQKSLSYNNSIELKLLFQEYLLLRFFNFNNYPNIFIKNTGYGLEIKSPLGASVLPKKAKKISRNKCLN